MFTGLIQEVGAIEALRPRGGGLELTLSAPGIGPVCEVGESIAVNGTCLTVERALDAGFVCFAGVETVERTTVGEFRSGQAVNLERALAVGEHLGGHFVQGHVDCVGVMTGRREEGETVRFSFEMPGEFMSELVTKGSIAVDGISLTLTDVGESGFGVAVIPHTLASTALRDARPGRRVNIETDILAKYVGRLVRGDAGPSEGLTEGFLAEHGFM
jgi:riboflavin synthase